MWGSKVSRVADSSKAENGIDGMHIGKTGQKRQVKFAYGFGVGF